MRIICGTILVAVFALNAVAGKMSSRVIAPWNGEVTSVSTNDGVVCVDYALRPTERSFIRCQLLLPAKEKWSGRFWGQGNGGQAGGKPGAMPAFANVGDAVAHTDMGSSDDRDYGNPEAWTDFSHRATHLMTLSAKALVKAHYGRPPDFSYFYGASTGGNQGLMEAERHPEDYDAVLAIVPAFARVPYHVKYVWNARQVFSPDGSRALSDSQIATVEKAVLDWFADKDEPHARGKYLAMAYWTPADMDGVLALAWVAVGAKREGLLLVRNADIRQRLDARSVVLHDSHSLMSNLWGAFERVRRDLSGLRLHRLCRGVGVGSG